MKSTVRICLLIYICVFLVAFAGTWSIPLIDRDEPRFAEASREMLERGDFVVPYFNNKYRFDKPAFIYWCQAGAYILFAENEMSARLPSCLAMAGTAVLIFLLGRGVRNEKVGLIGAAAFSVCPVTLYIGKAATADMMMVFFVTAAALAGWKLLEGAPKRWGWWFMFYASLGLGFLTKGPVAWLPLGTYFITCALLRDRPAARRAAVIPGLIFTLAIAASWGIPAQIATNGEFFKVGIGKHVVARGVTAMEGHGAEGALEYLLWLPFHPAAVFVFFLPWAFAIPGMWRWFWREGKTDRDVLYLGVAVGLTFLLFTLYTTKLPHYTLPAYPMLALLFGIFCEKTGVAWESIRRRAAIVGGAVILLCLAVPPFVAPFFPSKNLYLQTRDWLKPEMQWASVDYTEGSLIWYYRTVVDGFHRSISERKVAGFMKDEGPRFVIVPTEKLPKLLPEIDPAWRTLRVKGFNLPKGRDADLTLVLKPE